MKRNNELTTFNIFSKKKLETKPKPLVNDTFNNSLDATLIKSFNIRKNKNTRDYSNQIYQDNKMILETGIQVENQTEMLNKKLKTPNSQEKDYGNVRLPSPKFFMPKPLYVSKKIDKIGSLNIKPSLESLKDFENNMLIKSNSGNSQKRNYPIPVQSDKIFQLQEELAKKINCNPMNQAFSNLNIHQSLSHEEKFRQRCVQNPFIMSHKWKFYSLYKLINLYFIEDIYKPNLISYFNKHEMLVFFKLLNLSLPNHLKFKNHCTLKTVIETADIFFNDPNIFVKVDKLTNNKRFVFRKIRSIMLNNLIKDRGLEDLSKKKKEKEFFKYYFKKDPVYKKFNFSEKKDLMKLMNVYYESKIHVVWNFTVFTNEFVRIFNRFHEELKESYYQETVYSLKFYLEYLGDKDIDVIRTSAIPIKRLPHNKKVIQIFKEEFEKAFSEYVFF